LSGAAGANLAGVGLSRIYVRLRFL
jgi:hypothetical protein